MVPLPSHSLKQWGQLGEILGGVRFPERGASRGPVQPPKPGGVVSNTGSNYDFIGKSKFKETVGAVLFTGTSAVFAPISRTAPPLVLFSGRK